MLIDPGDPIGPGLELAISTARERGGRIEAIALTQVAPDHAAGAEGLAEMLGGLPILAGPGAGAWLPYAVEALGDATPLAYGDVPLLAIHAPGPSPEHLAFVVGEAFAIAGDLDGRTGARSIPPDARRDRSIAASIARVRALAPGRTWLTSHPPTDPA